MRKTGTRRVTVKRLEERPVSSGLHKLLLLFRKEHRVTVAVILVVTAIILLVSSFMFLNPASLTGNNAINSSYSVGKNQSTSFQMPFHVAPYGYVNVSYNISHGSYVSLKLNQAPYKISGNGIQTTVETKTLNSTGVFSYREGATSHVDTMYFTLYSRNSPGNFSFNVTVTSYYPENVNAYLLGGSVLSFAAFSTTTAFLISKISGDPEAYWLRLDHGENDDTRRKLFRIVSQNGKVKREIRGLPLILFISSMVIISLDQSMFAGTAGSGTFQVMISFLALEAGIILGLYSMIIMAVNWIIGEKYE